MEQLTQFKTKIPIFKKPAYLLKNYLAKQYSKLYSKEIFIGVTGSLDRAICIDACNSVLSQKFKTITTSSKLEPTLSIPNVLLTVTPQVKKVILDMGVEQKNDMDFYLSLVQPKAVVVTKINLTNPETSDNLLQEEAKLIEQIPEDGIAIFNWEDPNSKKIAGLCKGKVLYYGIDQANCSIWAGNIKLEDFRTTFELNLGVERVKVNLQLLGSHQVYPMLAAAALGVVHSIPLTKIKIALESVEPHEHRLQPLFGPNGSIILDDTSSSTPTDLEEAIDAVLKIPARRKILVLGEMRGLGELSESLHRQVAQMIYKEKFDGVYLGMGDANIIADELKNLGFWEEKMQTNLQNSQLVSKLLKNLGKGDICLIKGSKAVRLDEVVKRIIKK